MLTFFFCSLLLMMQSPADAKPATVPFEIIGSKHMAVQIKINGKGPYRVIFDTGAPISLVSNKVATETGLIKKQAAGGFMGMGGMVKAKDFQVGDVQAKDIQLIVMDHPTVKAISEVVGPIEGIVGYPFFAKFRTTVNYQDKTLTMVPSGFEPGDVMASLMSSMMSNNKDKKVYLSPSTLWGLTVGKSTSDGEAGVEVVYLFGNGLAEQAGIKQGDRLLVLDGVWTDTLDDAYRAASQVKAGRTVKVKIKRDGQEKVIEVTPRTGL
ncbi:MAG TPA: aspartyl protease family protein [Gemmatales bacterium]|nr:aspartyl protease family protein [Gemmatales bacterium]